jgi:hypothetical protein
VSVFVIRRIDLRFDAVEAEKIHILFFWVLTSGSLTDGYQRLGKTYLKLQRNYLPDLEHIVIRQFYHENRSSMGLRSFGDHLPDGNSED